MTTCIVSLFNIIGLRIGMFFPITHSVCDPLKITICFPGVKLYKRKWQHKEHEDLHSQITHLH